MGSIQEDAVMSTFEETPLYKAIYADIEAYMSKFDMSHDMTHICRVLGLAKHIFAAERHRFTSDPSAESVVICAAMLHDVGDKKYAVAGESAEQTVHEMLLQHGCEQEFATKVSTIVANVSFSNEIKNPQQVQDVLARYPQLAVVQDADRLDAIGAVGIARCFAFGAAKASDRGLQGAIDHFVEKLENLEGMMKTETGRRLAIERTSRLKQFRGWWEEEASFAVEV